jgi:hypothetical protein
MNMVVASRQIVALRGVPGAARVQRGHGHQQAGRAAGEVGGLPVVRHMALRALAKVADALFEAQRFASS